MSKKEAIMDTVKDAIAEYHAAIAARDAADRRVHLALEAIEQIVLDQLNCQAPRGVYAEPIRAVCGEFLLILESRKTRPWVKLETIKRVV